MKSIRTTVVGLTALVGLAVIVVFGAACDGGREGDRCNPALSHSECGAGLSCVQPSTCVESYCCPANASSSSNAYCNGAACPAADAGAGGDGGADAADSAADTAPGDAPSDVTAE